jgi:hypothetical protein
MKRKHKLSIYDIGRLERTPVALPQGDAAPVGSLSEYRKQLAREEEEAAAKAEQKRIRAIEQAKLDELNSPAAQRIAKYFRQPLSELQVNGADFAPTDSYGTYEICSSGEANPVDWKKFETYLDSRGIVMYRSGYLRLSAYIESLAYHRNISQDSLSNWTTALDRLVSLNVFEEHELENYQSQSQPEPRKRAVPLDEPSLNDFENLDTHSREGNAKAKILAERLYLKQCSPIVQAWAASLQTNFGLSITEEQLTRVTQWFNAFNKPWTNPKAYDECRRAMVSMYVFPESCLLPEELLARDIENKTTPFDFASRRELANKLKHFGEKIIQ